MIQPLNTSFTLRPGSGDNKRQRLTLHDPAYRTPEKTSRCCPREEEQEEEPQQRRTKRTTCFRSFPFQSIENRMPPSEFEPPADVEYWKKRCFQWQEICQTSRKKVRDMEEDQRQLRRRIWELEERLLSSSNNCNSGGADDESNVPVSIGSRDRPPAMIVTIPQNRSSNSRCFYLTDSEGLSDSEDFAVDYRGDDYDHEDKRNDASCSRAR